VRRLVLARALMNDPELLVLDEPTTGLDPQARHLLWDRVRTLRARGRSVLLTTHYMDEAERLCDRIAVIDHGRVLAEDTPAALVDRFAGAEVIEATLSDDPAAIVRLKAVLEPAYTVEVHGAVARGYGRDGISLDAVDHLPGVLAVTRRRANLEDVFLRLAGREIRE
jgi:lipooligosaccharide transport system ATP-binding protein